MCKLERLKKLNIWLVIVFKNDSEPLLLSLKLNYVQNIAEKNRNNNPDAHVIVDGVKKRKIDWHNYKQIAEDEQRRGPGEQGLGVVLSSNDKKDSRKDQLFRENGFNAFVSDKISLQRALHDIRNPGYKTFTQGSGKLMSRNNVLFSS